MVTTLLLQQTYAASCYTLFSQVRIRPGPPVTLRLGDKHPFMAAAAPEDAAGGSDEGAAAALMTQLPRGDELAPMRVMSGAKLKAFEVGKSWCWILKGRQQQTLQTN